MKKILLLLLISSCAPTSKYSLNKLYYGQSKDDVVDIMGNAYTKRILDKDKEMYIYYVHDSVLDLILTSRFPFIGFYPINRTGKEVYLYFENDRLIKSIGE